MSDPVRAHIDQVKSQLNLRDYARDFLGIDVDRDDKSSCLFHLGEKVPSLHYYPTNFYCFSCKKSGDFIALHQAVNPGQSFLDIIDDASGFVGMGPCPRNNWTEEEIADYRKEVKERKRIEDINLAATEYFADCLRDDPEMVDMLTSKWGLERDFCLQKKIGYCPAGKTDLLTHLGKLGYSLEETVSSGLVVDYEKDGETRYGSAFRGRIVFPYWVGPKVVYFIGRKTDRTPEHPEKPAHKYKKLKVGKEDNNVSRHVKNWLYGMDFLYDRRYEEIIITEGITDAMKAEQHGIPVVSPVTTRLKKQDIADYINLFKTKVKIFIINDNEENHAGEMGAMDIAEMLEENGCNVRIGTIPRPDGVDKIDLADYLHQSDDPVEAIEKLKASARAPIVHKIVSMDPTADEMERNQQILSLTDMWARLNSAQVPAVMEIIKDHFGMKARQANALESSIKKLKKEAEKDKKKAASESSANKPAQQGLPLNQRIELEIETEGQGPAVGRRIYEWTRDWLIENGAKFYRFKTESRGIVFFRKKLYDMAGMQYQVMMSQVAGLNSQVQVHKVALRYMLTYVLETGTPIDNLSWVTTLPKGTKYLCMTCPDDDKIIMMDPERAHAEAVPNGDNPDNIILRPSMRMDKFEYDPDVSIEEGMRLYEKLIFNNMACDIQDRYFATAWYFLPFFVDELGTRPILHFGGDAGSGKTTSSKLYSVLLYGHEVHESGSTIAATYDNSFCNPCLFWDNKEQKEMSDDEMQFLIASATGASRFKKSGLGTGEVVKQTPLCMILSNSIEIFRKEELIQRTLIVNFKEQYVTQGFPEGRIKLDIAKHRNKILSAFVKIAHKVHRELQDTAYEDTIAERIRTDYPDNEKSRNMNAFVRMWAVMREVCKYIRQSYVAYDVNGDKVFVNFDGEAASQSPFDEIHHQVVGTWIFEQTTSHKEIVGDSNEILYFLNSLYRAWEVSGYDASSHGDFNQSIVNRFLERYHVSFNEDLGFPRLECTWSELHHACGAMSNTSIRYTINSSKNLANRVKTIRNILYDKNWAVAVNFRKSGGRRLNLFVPNATPEKIAEIEKKYEKRLDWLAAKRLVLLA